MRVLATALILLALLGGCSPPKVVLYLIEDTDMILIKKGEWPEELPPADGAYVSDFYLKEVMEAKVTD